MSEPELFSSRQGFKPASIIHDDAPIGFRHAVVGALKAGIISSDTIIGIVQRATTLPRPRGFVVDTVAIPMIEQCDWWRVFDVAEAGNSAIRDEPLFGSEKVKAYERVINEACGANNLGWQMEAGVFSVIASKTQHDDTAGIVDDLDAANFKTSAGELREAHGDLSRRPLPDITGGMQHAGAAIELLAREITGDVKLTLGDIIKKRDDLFPGAYGKMAEAMWGIVSNQGRHLGKQGKPSLEEALFVVGSITNLSAYLLARRSTQP